MKAGLKVEVEEFTAPAKAKAARRTAHEGHAAARKRGAAGGLANEFQTMTGQTKCRACGRKLTKHFKEEKTREAEAKAAEKKLKDLTDASTKAKSIEEELTAKEAADRDRLAKMRDEYKDAAAAVKQAASDITRLTKSCRDSYFALPQEYKDKLGATEPADWSKAMYPDRHDITELSTQAHGLDATKRKLADSSLTTAKVESARERRAKASQSLWRRPTALSEYARRAKRRLSSIPSPRAKRKSARPKPKPTGTARPRRRRPHAGRNRGRWHSKSSRRQAPNPGAGEEVVAGCVAEATGDGANDHPLVQEYESERRRRSSAAQAARGGDRFAEIKQPKTRPMRL